MEEVLRKTASQRNTNYRRKNKRIRIYNLKAYRKILTQLIICCLILILIVSAKSIDNPLANEAKKRIDDCISSNIDWKGTYNSASAWLSNIASFSKSLIYPGEKNKAADQIKETGTPNTKQDLDTKNVSKNEQQKAIIPSNSGENISKTVTPVFSSINSMDIDIDYIKSKYKLAIPVNSAISSRYGIRINPITHKEELHPGIDISANTGTSIHAAFAGEIIESRKGTTFGNYIKIKTGKDIVSVYAHCSKLLVKKGQKVAKGQVIAKVGNTGMSLGPHVHFEVWRGDRTVNPTSLLSFSK